MAFCGRYRFDSRWFMGRGYGDSSDSPDHGKKGIWKVTGNDVEVIPIDVAFPVLHGKFGEDGTIQGLFELAWEFRMWDVMF